MSYRCIFITGGAWAGQLELLRQYHREHGHVGKRYVEIIREFNPHYAPRTAAQLAHLSRNIPALTTT